MCDSIEISGGASAPLGVCNKHATYLGIVLAICKERAIAIL